jgi:hypothetical protein
MIQNLTSISTNLSQEETLLQLLQKERSYYHDIFEITQEEHAQLSNKQPISNIRPLLKKKQTLMLNIHEIDTQLKPLKDVWQKKKERTDSLSLQIQQELTELNHLLAKILQINKVSEKKVEMHLQQLKEKQINDLHL